MKVGIVQTEDALKTGQFRYSSQLIKNLEKILEGELNIHQLAQKEYEIHGRLIGGFFSLWVQKLLSNFDDDIIHALDPPCAPKNADVVTIHDLIPFKFPDIYQKSVKDKLGYRLNKWITKKIPYFIVQTEHVKNDLVRIWGVNEERIFVTPPGISHEIIYPSDNVPKEMETNKKTLLHVGDENPRKNLLLIVKSMKHLEDVRLVWVGGSKLTHIRKKCENLAKKHGLDLVRAGYVEDEELKDYYTHADVLVRPSLDDGTGYPPLEAAACGTTSVVSDIEVFHEVLDGNAYFTDLDEKSLADNIEKALDEPIDPDVLKDYAGGFNWKVTAETTFDAYRDIFESKW